MDSPRAAPARRLSPRHTPAGQAGDSSLRVLTRAGHTSSSKRLCPRRPSITTRRSAVVHTTVPAIWGCPAKDPKRSQIGASRAWQSSSRPLHRSTSTSLSRSSRLSTILSVRPPLPAGPLNGTVATVAPRRSSSAHTPSRASSSYRFGRSRASWIRDASRPEGVRQDSPGLALHFGHGRARHPRAMWSADGFAVVRWPHGSRHRAPGAARHVGHHSSSHRARSLTAIPPSRAERPRRRCEAALFSRHRADAAVRRRSAGSDQGQPWKCSDAASLVFRPHSVHQFHLGRISAAAAVHSGSGELQAIRARR